MGLCYLGGLRGLCGFCARVELGGYMTCGVFASNFCLFALPFVIRFISLRCLLSFFALVVFICSLALSLWFFGCGCCFLFPFRMNTQKERAQFLASSLRVLRVFRVLYSYRKTPLLCIWLFPVRPVDNAN